MKIRRVIRAANKGAGSDVLESFSAGNIAVVIELVRRDIFDYRQMFRGWAEILTHRQNLATNFTQVVHRLEKLGLFLTEAEHDTTFGHNFRRQLPGTSQHLQ
jgi:hypothetical protein